MDNIESLEIEVDNLTADIRARFFANEAKLDDYQMMVVAAFYRLYFMRGVEYAMRLGPEKTLAWLASYGFHPDA